MCDPVTMTAMVTFVTTHAATIAAVGTVAATGLSVAGISQQAKAQKASATYQAQLADVNATYADRAARDAIERGNFDALKHGRQQAQLRAQQTAGAAASGLDLSFGSPSDIAMDTDVLGSQDRGRIAENANREADSYRISAQGYRNSSAGSRAERSNIGSAAMLDSASTLIGGATKIAGGFAKYGSNSYAPRIFG